MTAQRDTSRTHVTPTGAGLYVYAFLRATARLPAGLVGLGPEAAPVGLVGRDGLAVLTSDVDVAVLADLSQQDAVPDSELAKQVQQHDRVVRAAFEDGPVLPFRFGIVLAGLTAAIRLVVERRDRVLTLLSRVDGKREWGIRLRATQGSRQPEPPAEADRSSGASYLASRGRQLAEADRQRDRQRDTAEAVRAELAPLAAELVTRARSDGPLDVALLIGRDAEDDFLATVDRLAARAADVGLVLDTTGPWPPYTFSRTALEVSDD